MTTEHDPALVEKAAKALWVSLLGKHRRGDTWPDQHGPWWLAQGRAVLDAVTPAIRAAALLEAADRLAESIADLSYINCTQIDIRTLRDMAVQRREEAPDDA
jgi:hypothetical protein